MHASAWAVLGHCAWALAASKRAASTTAGAAPSASTPPPADEVTIQTVSTSGTGCPDNSVSVSLSADLTSITLGFDAFETYIGPGVGAAQSDKSCIAHLSLRYPPGYTFAVAEATYHGYAQLDAGVTGRVSSVYAFEDGADLSPLAGTTGSGAAADSSSTAVSIGASSSSRSRSSSSSSSSSNRSRPARFVAQRASVGQVYTETDTIPAGRVVNAPCGRTVDLVVNTTVVLSSTDPAASGELTDDDATVGFTQGVHFGWRRCSLLGVE